MFETSIDAWYAWLGVAAASLAAAGTVLALPAAAPPTTAPVADTVDRVATSPHDARATVAIEATEYRVTRHQIGLRTEGGRSHATFRYGPVTPVGDASPIREVLEGRSPRAIFESSAAFARAVEHERQQLVDWQPAPDRLTVRHVTWGDVDATLVG